MYLSPAALQPKHLGRTDGATGDPGRLGGRVGGNSQDLTMIGFPVSCPRATPANRLPPSAFAGLGCSSEQAGRLAGRLAGRGEGRQAGRQASNQSDMYLIYLASRKTQL